MCNSYTAVICNLQRLPCLSETLSAAGFGCGLPSLSGLAVLSPLLVPLSTVCLPGGFPWLRLSRNGVSLQVTGSEGLQSLGLLRSESGTIQSQDPGERVTGDI
jgi:hypothetical protein